MESPKALLGRRIRYFRKLRGMTQEELGPKAGLTYKYLGAIERGEKNPSIDSLAKIATALGVEIHELFVFEQETDDSKALKRMTDDMLKQASKKDVKTIYRVVKAILK